MVEPTTATTRFKSGGINLVSIIRRATRAVVTLYKSALNHSGGTGSKLPFHPSSTINYCVVESYNALFATHWLLDHAEVSLMLNS